MAEDNKQQVQDKNKQNQGGQKNIKDPVQQPDKNRDPQGGFDRDNKMNKDPHR